MKRALILLVCLFAGAAQAAPVPSVPAMCVGDWCLSQPAFDLLFKNVQVSEPTLDAAAVKQQLVDVRLLANYARTQHFQVEGDPYGVGFAPSVKLEQERYGLFSSQLNGRFVAYAKASLGKEGLNAFLTAPLHDSGLDIDSALKPANPKAIAMTDAQQQAAAKVVLVSFQFPGEPERHFTLADLYQRQNVQGRLALQQPNASTAIREQVHAYIKRQYFYWWLEHKSGLSTDDIKRVDEALADRQLNNAWLEHQGLVDVMHDDSSTRLEEVAGQVSQTQVEAWYQQHKNSFRITNSVRAQHLACASEADCAAGRKALLAGEPVATIVTKYADKTHQGATDLGELTRVQDGMQWLTSLALLQQPGGYSRPVRAPDGHWEVVWVTDKKSGYLPVDSSSVRYQASRAIARAQLLAEHKQLMQRLRQQTKVVVQ